MTDPKPSPAWQGLRPTGLSWYDYAAAELGNEWHGRLHRLDCGWLRGLAVCNCAVHTYGCASHQGKPCNCGQVVK